MKMFNDAAGRPVRLTALAVALAMVFALAACGKSGEKDAAAGDSAKSAEKSGDKKEKEGDHKEGEKALTLTTEEAEKAGVKVQEIKAETMGETIVVTATIEPNQERVVRVAPRVEGRVIAMPAKLGDRVAVGQTLATLDSVAVGEAHAAWVQAQAEQRIAESDFKRAESLIADEIIPRKDFLRAQAERDKTAANARNAADRLRLLGGAPRAQGGGVSTFALTSPFAGTVIEKKASLGGLASPSEPIFTIADLGLVWIQAALPESALAKVRVGASAKVTVPAYPAESFSGRVAHIGAGVNKDSRTVAARIEVTNADGRLKPEMFATATIEVAGEKRGVMTLPDDAIVLMQGQPTVFVFEQGAYAARVVEPGERMGGRTVLKAGIKPGEQVVTAGAYALKARTLKSQISGGH
ncbi:MAG: efflux RND transporter periplasmic adaptor subunit [Burkholderiales bacterium]|nr:efflux RND transporter periplasmic adaptor subunit [Burkholderiales bacterium]